MKVLVTGSSGHIGGAVARHLDARGFEVVGLSRGLAHRLPESIWQVCADIGDNTFLKEAPNLLEPCDAVVHAAACVDSSYHEPAVSRTNCLGTQQVLELARKWSAKRFVFLSGVNVYGFPTAHPITEEHPPVPVSPYAASKLYGEQLVAMTCSYEMHGIGLRLTSPVGPGLWRKRIFSIFVARALAGEPLVLDGHGTRRQNYVDVRDIAGAVLAALSGKTTGVFNIGGVKTVSNLELAELCTRTLGSSSSLSWSGEPDPHDGMCWDVSSYKATSQLGYAPEYSLEDSFRALADELREEATQ